MGLGVHFIVVWTLICRVLLSNQGRPYTCDPPASALTALYHTDCALSSQGLVAAGWAGEGTQYVFQPEVLFLLLLDLQTFKFGTNSLYTFTSSDFPLGLVV